MKTDSLKYTASTEAPGLGLDAPTGSVSSETVLTDRQRWELLGKPEIICHDDGEGRACYHIGEDVEDRCCELCGRDEPEEEMSECPDCGVEVWWVPKCPDCGNPATWTYGEIKPLEFEEIKSSQNV